MKLSGIFAAVTTPFDHNGEIYRTKIEHNLTRWNPTSLAGYLVGSSAGEGFLLTFDEKILVWELTAKYAGPNRILMADVSVEGVREAAALACRAAQLGYQAVCARAPSHYEHAMQIDEWRALFFRALADRSPLPLIVCGYGSWMSLVSRHPNIGGVVLNGNAQPPIQRVLADAHEGFQVLVGSVAHLWTSLRDGAHGAILPFAAAAPYAAIAVWEAFRTREEEAGVDWQDRIRQPGRLVEEIYHVPGLKHAMDLNGYYGGPPRLPLTPLSAGAQDEIAKAFDGFSGKT